MKDFLWHIFETSGNIEAFLAYKHYSVNGNEEPLEGSNLYGDFCDKRSGSTGNKVW